MNTKLKYGVLGGSIGLALWAFGTFTLRTFVDHNPILGAPQIALLLVGVVALVAGVMAVRALRLHCVADLSGPNPVARPRAGQGAEVVQAS